MLAERNLKFFKQFVAGAVGVLVGLAAQAQLFTGSISFVGGAVIDNPIPGATAFTSFSGPGTANPLVQSADGVYSGVPLGSQVAFTPFTFSPAPAPFQLWSFTIGATTYSFDITTTTENQTILPGGVAFLNVGGTGQAFVTGYSPTPASWSITGTSANSAAVTITIGSSVNAVPEPSTWALAAMGLVVTGLIFRRRFKPAFQKK